MTRFVNIDTEESALPYNIEARVSLEADEATAGQLAQLHRYASEGCPLTNLVRTATPVTVLVESV